MTVVLSYGMGVDSTAILLRWLSEPASRTFELDDLIVLTAQTGDEFPETGTLVEAHVLPRLANAGVRFVEVARKTASRTDGILVLQDTRYPHELHLGGGYKLSEELLTAGTVPQVASGKRLCSVKAKGWPLDTWMDANVHGQYRHAIGFAVGEERRRDRDQSYGGDLRAAEYPLMDWGWDRDQAIAYIAHRTGVDPWPKSCCAFCPFAKDNHGERYLKYPELGADAMVMEFLSLTLNPRSTLFSSKSVIQVHRDSDAGRMFEKRVSLGSDLEWALYRIRRVMFSKGTGARAVEPIDTGRYLDMKRLLREHATEAGVAPFVDEHGIDRALITERGDTFPTIEHTLAVGPAGVHKVGPQFRTAWAKATQPTFV